MLKKIGLITALCLFMSLPAMAGDLYLLKIDSRAALEKVKNVIDYAHGMIDGKFIVELEESQVQKLKSAGIPPDLMAENIDLKQYYLLSKIHPDMKTSPLTIQPLFASGNEYLVAVNKADIDVLRRGGYMVVPIGEQKTPLFYLPKMVPSAGTREDYPLDTLADLVSQDSLYSYDTRLEAFQTRFIYTDSVNAARDWLVNKFEEFGYTDVYYDDFYFDMVPCHNVICIKPGTVEPDKLIVVGGHYDSINQESDPMTFAPGADDNGSGTTTVLELARVFKDIDTRKSIMFVAFSAEEVGLVGSHAIAQELYNSGTDVEFMVNFDMVAYTEDSFDDVTLFSGTIAQTVDVLAQAAERVTNLIPMYGGMTGNSDHASFSAFGYPAAYAQEGDFNYPGWHTDIDISSRLDFPYFEQVVRMAAAALGHIDNAAHVTPIENVYDVGDGQSLRVAWGDCEMDYNYQVLYGTESGNYTDTVDAPASSCYFDLTGLTIGQKYYITVRGINPLGYGPLYQIEGTGTPYVVPRPPSNVQAEPDYQKINLSWDKNIELDLDHYVILRKPSGGDWSVLVSSYTDTTYEDIAAEYHVDYDYMILAVDSDMNVSDSSLMSSAVAASFDYPLLYVDETLASGGINPTEQQEATFYPAIFSGWTYDEDDINTGSDRLGRSLAGQYKSIIWIDDDVSTQLLGASADSLRWYLGYNSNLCVAGWQTIAWLAGSSNPEPGDFVYDYFGISTIDENVDFDFTGANGENGWPKVDVNPDNIFSGVMPYISTFTLIPGAEVIYRFNSATSNPEYQDQPCGVAYDTPNGKRVALGFPLFYLNESDAQALISKICTYFGMSSEYAYGDVNLDGTVNIFDITYIVAYLYLAGPPPSFPNLADTNGDCTINIFDITRLVSYLYLSGEAPVAGCVE
jgi:hypothetical protein